MDIITTIDILANNSFFTWMGAYSMLVLVLGSWYGLLLALLEDESDVGNYSMQQDLAYPRVRPNLAWESMCQALIDGTEPLEVDDRLTTQQLEVLFYGYTMDSLETALELVNSLVVPGSDVAACWELLLDIKIEAQARATAVVEEVVVLTTHQIASARVRNYISASA